MKITAQIEIVETGRTGINPTDGSTLGHYTSHELMSVTEPILKTVPAIRINGKWHDLTPSSPAAADAYSKQFNQGTK
jgi:hypothetical protein